MILIPTNAFKFLIAPQDALLASEDAIPTIDKFYWLAAVDGSDISSDRTITKRKTGEGKRMNDGHAVVSGMGAGGTIEAIAQDKMLGLLFWAALGSDDVTGTTDPFAHAATPNQTGGLPYLTVIKHVGDLWEAYPNCKINELTLRVACEGDAHIMTVSMGLMGVGVVRYLDGDPISSVTPEVEKEDGEYTWNQALGTWEVDGSLIASIADFTVTIRNNLIRVCGEGLAGYALAEGELEIEAASTVTVEDLDRYLETVYGTTSPGDGDEAQPIIPVGSFAATFTRVAGETGPPAVLERSFEVDIPELRYEAETPRVEGNTEGRPLQLAMAGLATGDDPKATFTTTNGVEEYFTSAS